MQKKIFLVIPALVIVLAGVGGGAWWWMQRDGTGGNGTTNQQNTNQTNNSNFGGNTNTSINSANTNTNGGNTNTGGSTVEQNEATVLRLARVFLERYGTFSNRNSFENITSLEPFMTQRFIKASAEYISDQQNSSGIPDEFYGITTTVGSMEIAEYTAGGTARVRVSSRRLETKGTTTADPFTQIAIVHFKSVDGAWKVDNVVWE